ncbi:MAG TPA: alpha,alpha-trehalose-phosphate synthase (UDP-forming) [Rudaea sp.]|jgi:trehalose 6-phosphate synthase|nr:alpha,alpha-trehalose-phosphate synthase (UDP-forming) [Rudaea sp.]
MSSRIDYGPIQHIGTQAHDHANYFHAEDDAANAQSSFADLDAQMSRPSPQSHADMQRSSVTSFMHPNIGQIATENSNGDGRLIVVSNRVALPKDTRAGGLASALKGALAERGGIWFGWSGQVSAEPRFDIQPDPVYPIKYATLDLDRDDYEGYYAGFSNRVLWPLFHYRLHLLDFNRDTLAAYRRVSAKFADKLAALVKPDDTIWVHDYHLIPLGAALRSRGVECRIGFFLHTPIAPPELIASLPHHRDLMSSFSSYDLVGFQTQTDQRSFTQYCETELDGIVDHDGHVEVHGRHFRVGTFPISIDTAHLETLGQRAATSTNARRLNESMEGRVMLIGVDRLDYSKGLPERFLAYRRLINEHPDLQRQITLLQIAPTSREDVPEYRDLRRKLENLAGSINSEFAEPDWAPIRYVNKSYQQARLAGFYRASRVGLVTPLRDGMNLVAKEYIAAQDPNDPGVLILSRFAGAAHELTEALLVNPFDEEQVVGAMQQALMMPLGERKRRWQRMMEYLRKHDVNAWRNRFLDTLQACPHVSNDRSTGTANGIVRSGVA